MIVTEGKYSYWRKSYVLMKISQNMFLHGLMFPQECKKWSQDFPFAIFWLNKSWLKKFYWIKGTAAHET